MFRKLTWFEELSITISTVMRKLGDILGNQLIGINQLVVSDFVGLVVVHVLHVEFVNGFRQFFADIDVKFTSLKSNPKQIHFDYKMQLKNRMTICFR